VSLRRLYTDSVLLTILFLLAALSSAQDLDSAARDLSRRIVSGAGRQDVASLTVRNASSLSTAEVADIARVLEAELRVRPSRSGATVNVTLSENVQSYLWIAEIRRGEERELTMLSVARPAAPGAVLARVVIEKRLLWEQDKPILDAAVVDSLLIVLDAGAVAESGRHAELLALDGLYSHLIASQLRTTGASVGPSPVAAD